jgi:hypothetical protein
MLKDGTVLAVEESSYNFTGTTAQSLATGLFAGLVAEINAGGQLGTYTSSSYFHSTGTSSVTIGSTPMTVTNYAPIQSLPMTVVYCGGSTTLTAYDLSVGTPPGTSYQLITHEHLAGTSTQGQGKPESFDFTLQITSITVG